MNQSLVVHDEICGARGVRRHCGTHVHIRRDGSNCSGRKHTEGHPHLGSALTFLAVNQWVQSPKGPEMDCEHEFGVLYVS